jgi:hypothetical protein
MYKIHNCNFVCCFVTVLKLAVALREELRLKVFENWMLRKAFDSKREELAGDWRILRIVYKLTIRASHQALFRCQKEKNWIGGVCGISGGEQKCTRYFGEETWRKEILCKRSEYMK